MCHPADRPVLAARAPTLSSAPATMACACKPRRPRNWPTTSTCPNHMASKPLACAHAHCALRTSLASAGRPSGEPPPTRPPPNGHFPPAHSHRALAAGCNDSWHGRAPKRQLRRPGGGSGGAKPPPRFFFAILAVCSHLPSQVWSKGKLHTHTHTRMCLRVFAPTGF